MNKFALGILLIASSLAAQVQINKGVQIGSSSGGSSGPQYNVVTYGADPTGTTDNSTVYATVYALVRATGGTMLWPQGTYKGYLDISSCTTQTNQIYFSGYGAILVPATSPPQSAIFYGDDSGCSGGFNFTKITIEGFVGDTSNTLNYVMYFKALSIDWGHNYFANAKVAAVGGYFIQYARSYFNYYNAGTFSGTTAGFQTNGGTNAQSNEITSIGDRFNTNSVGADIHGGQSIRFYGSQMQNNAVHGWVFSGDTAGQAPTSIGIYNFYAELAGADTVTCTACVGLTVKTGYIAGAAGGGGTTWMNASLVRQMDIQDVVTPFQPAAVLGDTSADDVWLNWIGNTQDPTISGVTNSGTRHLHINDPASPAVDSNLGNTASYLGSAVSVGNTTNFGTFGVFGSAPYLYGNSSGLVLGPDSTHQNVFLTTASTNFGTVPVIGQTLTFTGVVTGGGLVLTGAASGCAQFNSSGVLSSSGSACGSGGGNTTSTMLTTNSLPKANGANSIINSLASDNGSVFSIAEPLSVTGSGTFSGPGSSEISLIHSSGTSPGLPATSFTLLSPLTNPTTSFGFRGPSSWAGGFLCAPAPASDSESLLTTTLAPCTAASTIITVAASNSVIQNTSTYVATGSGDQSTLQAAINACPASLPSSTIPNGCSVLLQPGIYYVTGTTTIDNDNVTLFCLSKSFGGGYAGAYTSPSSPTFPYSIGGCQIRATNTTVFPLITFAHVNSGGTGGDAYRHRGNQLIGLNLQGFISGSSYYQTGVATTALGSGNTGAGDDSDVFLNDNCNNLVNCITGNYDSPLIDNLNCQGNSGDCVSLPAPGVFGKVVNSLLYDIGGRGVVTGDNGFQMNNDTVGDTVGAGVELDSTSGATIGNTVTLTGTKGGGVKGLAIRGSLIDPVCNFNTPGFAFNDGGAINSASCVSLDLASAGNTVRGTYDAANSLYGPMTVPAISILGASNTLIAGQINGCWGFSGGVCGAAISATDTSNTIIGPTYASTQVAAPVLIGQFLGTGGLPATNGSALTSWTDTSTRAKTLATIGSTAPLYESSGNAGAVPNIRFSGTASQGIYNNTNFTVPLTDTCRTIFMALNLSTLPSVAGHAYTLVAGNISGGALPYSLFISTSNKLSAYTGSTFNSTLTTFVAGTTYTIEAVLCGNASRMSINGTAIQSGWTSGPGQWTGGIYIGSDSGLTTGNLAADVQDVEVYLGNPTTAQASTIGNRICTASGTSGCSTTW